MTPKEKAAAKTYLRQFYKYVWAYTIPRKEDLSIRKASSSSLYGEITFASLDKLIKYLKIGQKDVFFDLGSGIGKVVLQVAMTTKAKKVVGVELSKSRFKESIAALKAAAKEKWLDKHKCKILNKNILDADLSKATVIYTCSTAFPGTFMRKLAKKLAAIKKPIKIVTTQEMPENCGLTLVDKLQLDMSWARKTSVFVFTNESEEVEAKPKKVAKVKKPAKPKKTAKKAVKAKRAAKPKKRAK